MSKIPDEEQCRCPPEKHNAANPLTSFVQGLFGGGGDSTASKPAAAARPVDAGKGEPAQKIEL